MDNTEQTSDSAKGKLLADVPATTDLLGGAYKQISQGMATLISTSDGGKCVRLDGEWGAGKSTVIAMLSGLLENVATNKEDQAVDCPYAVFQFDAWVHSGDPLKLAFLRALVNKLESKGWLRKPSSKDYTNKDIRQSWNNRLDILAGRVKRVNETSNTNFSENTKIEVGIVLAGLAVWSVLLPYLLEQTKKWGIDLGPLMYTLLLIFIVFACVQLVPGRLLSLAVKLQADSKQTETISDGTMTSVEFQDVFKDLMKTSLTSKTLSGKKKKLIIVVDNLDRVDDKQISEVWTLLRSFLDNPVFVKEPWFSQLWVIVPTADATRLQPDSVQNETYLEKAFQVRLSIPQPMLHSWKDYLRGKLREAFRHILDSDLDDILRIFELYRPEPTVPKTTADPALFNPHPAVRPREILNFINDLVALQIEWEGNPQATLPVLAAYCLALRHGRPSPSLLPKFPDSVVPLLHKEKLDEIIAMLHFHATDTDEAAYFLALPSIEKAVRAGSAIDLQALLDRSMGGAFLLSTYLHRRLRSLRNHDLLRAIQACAPIRAKDGTNILKQRERDWALTGLRQDLELSFHEEGIAKTAEAVLDYFSDVQDELTGLFIKGFSGNPKLNTGGDTRPSLSNLSEQTWKKCQADFFEFLELPAVKRLLLTDNAQPFCWNFSGKDWLDFGIAAEEAQLTWLFPAVCPTSNLHKDKAEAYWQELVASNLSGARLIWNHDWQDDRFRKAFLQTIDIHITENERISTWWVREKIDLILKIKKFDDALAATWIRKTISLVGIHIFQSLVSNIGTTSRPNPSHSDSAQWLILSLWAWQTIPNQGNTGSEIHKPAPQEILRWINIERNAVATELRNEKKSEAMARFILDANLMPVLHEEWDEPVRPIIRELELVLGASQALRDHLHAQGLTPRSYAADMIRDSNRLEAFLSNSERRAKQRTYP